MTRVEWNNEAFIGDVLACLPELGQCLQSATFYRPPDSDPKSFAPAFLNNFPYNYNDVKWQVKFSMAPLFNKWFSELKGRDFPPTTKSDDEAYRIALEYDDVSFRINQLFSITSYIAMLGQFIPYGRIALHVLSEKEWGEIVNVAAITSLQFLEDSDASHDSIIKIFGSGSINLETNWKDINSRDTKQYRIYNPEELPIFYWRQVFVSLRKKITRNDPLLLSLLSYAHETKSDEMCRSILRLSLDLGLFTPFNVTGFIEYCELPGTDIRYFQKAAKDPDLQHSFPELIKDLEDRNSFYFERYKEG